MNRQVLIDSYLNCAKRAARALAKAKGALHMANSLKALRSEFSTTEYCGQIDEQMTVFKQAWGDYQFHSDLAEKFFNRAKGDL